jgi:hypothetical protein
VGTKRPATRDRYKGCCNGCFVQTGEDATAAPRGALLLVQVGLVPENLVGSEHEKEEETVGASDESLMKGRGLRSREPSHYAGREIGPAFGN